MKTAKRAVLLVLCAMLLVIASVLGTMAYLTSTDEVTNTFTVGKVGITLDEADVDLYGVPEEGAERVGANEYKLISGHEYTKDPTIHVEANSEDAYLFVKVENGISDIEAADNNIATQLATNGWTLVDGQTNVYYHTTGYDDADTSKSDFVVFKSFTVDSAVDGGELGGYASAKIVVTAYAIQKDGLADANAAWTALDAQLNPAPAQ